MDAVVLQVAWVCTEERVEIDDLQTILLRHFLLDGNDAIGDDGIVDVPRWLQGGE